MALPKDSDKTNDINFNVSGRDMANDNNSITLQKRKEKK